MSDDGPVLACGALLLRPPVDDDVPELGLAFADPAVARIAGAAAPGAAVATAWLERQRAARAAGRRLMLAIVEDGRLAGTIDADLRNAEDGRCELGYWVVAAARGRGVARSAIRCFAAWLFAERGVGRVELLIEPYNEASRRAARAAGFTCEGVLRSLLEFESVRHDLESWSLLPGEV